MELLVRKDNNEIIVKELLEKEELDFDYVKMINALFNKETVILKFADSINKDDQESIKKMFDKLKELSNKKEV